MRSLLIILAPIVLCGCVDSPQTTPKVQTEAEAAATKVELEKEQSESPYADWVLQNLGEFSKAPEADLREKLSAMQFSVTQEEGTESKFDNAYWDNKREGIYVDIVSGEPLFSSKDKFRSGTGWPSFTQPLHKSAVTEHKDSSAFLGERVEVRSRVADSHLGHVFDDGPAPTGLRYCMNSASMRFIPRDDLKTEGYAQFVSLFEEKKADDK